ncbi:uncharacterized protein LOC115309871 [Ixodes scapularis]|uniref:uncharacterized protein LOC115309871 n=1 Tax=Ixodes scapularis TaxID=6945 RepID=UPI001AA005B7|nr:uncharacterized protein LOC115309871 [Ixodes scapularis]
MLQKCEETKKFAVVEFLNENTVEAVPLSWVSEDKRGRQLCYWPDNMSGVEIKNYVKVSHISDGSWPRYTVKILARCNTYKKAKRKAGEAETLSCLETTDAGEPDDEVAAGGSQDSNAPSSTHGRETLPAPLPGRFGRASSQGSIRADHPLEPSKQQMRTEPQHVTSQQGLLDSCDESSASAEVLEHTITPSETHLLKIVLEVRAQNKHIEQQNRELLATVGQVLRHLVAVEQCQEARLEEQARPDVPELFEMSISTMEEFWAVDKRLRNATDQGTAGIYEGQLLSLGESTSLPKVIQDMVGRLLSKGVQDKFSLLGQRFKLSFKSTNMCGVIIGAIRARLPSCVVEAAEKKLSRYLSGAPDREGGRARRVQKKSLSEEVQEAPATLAPSLDEELDTLPEVPDQQFE